MFEHYFDDEKCVPLESLCSTFVDGDWIESKDQDETGIRLIQTGNIGLSTYLDKADKARFINEETFERLNCTEVLPGDILISRLPDPIARSCIVPEGLGKSITGVDCTIVRFNGDVNSVYFNQYTLMEHYLSQVTAFEAGSTRKRISRKNLGKIKVPLPPVDLQNQFASFVKQVDKSRVIFVCIVKSRFIELFGIPTTNTLGWPTKPMKKVAPSEQFSLEPSDEDNWLLNLDAVQSDSGQILFKNRVPSSEIKGSIMSFTDKHVLYSKLRPYLNKVVVPDEFGFGTTELIPLLPDSKYLTRLYLAYLLRSDAFVSKFSAAVAGTKMPRVSMGTFWNFEVPLPPIELQNEFASFVEQVDKSRFELQRHLENTRKLQKALINQVFEERTQHDT